MASTTQISRLLAPPTATTLHQDSAPPSPPPRRLNPGYRVPATTVQLGTVLDLAVQRHQYRYDIGEFKGWHLLAAANAATQKSGYARLWLLPGRLESPTDNPPAAAVAQAEKTYRTWTRRHPEKIGEIETPESIGYYQGRVIRIGYRSDKWTGRPTDYDHDFLNEGTPPKIYTDAPRIENSRGAILTGGSFRITSRGIE